VKRSSKNAHAKRSCRQLVRIALRDRNGDRGWAAIHELRMRGSPEILALTRLLCGSPTWRRRELGMNLAAQLRRRQRASDSGSVEYAPQETRQLLLAGLHDAQAKVIEAAAAGLGHRANSAALGALVRLAVHRNTSIRFSVAFALANYPEPEAIAALLRLAQDVDDEVRDWATFGLGTQQEASSPEILQRLWENLNDRDRGVRGEALAGLASRGDPRALDYLLEHLGADCSNQDLEAAEKLASPRLLPALQTLANQSRWDGGDWRYVLLGAAIHACTPSQPVAEDA
jgi:HEAT repeat protein